MSNDIKFHVPVMLEEVSKGLNIQEGKKYIDATVGGGGHGVEIIKRGGILLGIDVDQEALAYAKKILRYEDTKILRKNVKNTLSIPVSQYPSIRIVQGNFKDIEKIAKDNGFDQVSGILFDLGVSSHQLDTAARGFSYRFAEADLDLRLNQNEGEPASSLVNRLGEDELYEIFAKFGEEKRARTVAAALVRARRLAPVNKIGELVRVVASLVPEREKNATLSRIFQGLRIAVNDELNNLERGLAGAGKLLLPGGRLVVVSFQSLEDRRVKQYLRGSGWKILNKKPVIARREEIIENSRARSAKLRIAEKL